MGEGGEREEAAYLENASNNDEIYDDIASRQVSTTNTKKKVSKDKDDK